MNVYQCLEDIEVFCGDAIPDMSLADGSGECTGCLCADGNGLSMTQVIPFNDAESKWESLKGCVALNVITTNTPSIFPTASPSIDPSDFPTKTPTAIPTAIPTSIPTTIPTMNPSLFPSINPSPSPTMYFDDDEWLYHVVISIIFSYSQNVDDQRGDEEILNAVHTAFDELITEQIIKSLSVSNETASNCVLGHYSTKLYVPSDSDSDSEDESGHEVIVNATISVCDVESQETLTADFEMNLESDFVKTVEAKTGCHVEVSEVDITPIVYDGNTQNQGQVWMETIKGSFILMAILILLVVIGVCGIAGYCWCHRSKTQKEIKQDNGHRDVVVDRLIPGSPVTSAVLPNHVLSISAQSVTLSNELHLNSNAASVVNEDHDGNNEDGDEEDLYENESVLYGDQGILIKQTARTPKTPKTPQTPQTPNGSTPMDNV